MYLQNLFYLMCFFNEILSKKFVISSRRIGSYGRFYFVIIERRTKFRRQVEQTLHYTRTDGHSCVHGNAR